MADSGIPQFFGDLISWYSMEALAVGHALGLRAALLDGAGTVEQVADRAGADRRSATTWLSAMVAAGYATHRDGMFDVAPEQRTFLDGTFSGVDTLALFDFIVAMGARVPNLVEVLSSGATAPPGLFGGEFGDAVGRVNGPLYAEALVGDWLAADAALSDRLRAGATVVDVACGDGTVVGIMARAFPASRFIGVDRDEDALGRARLTIRESVQFQSALPSSFDVVTILDSVHHFADPGSLLSAIRGSLSAGGVLVIAESSYTGDIDTDTASPFSVIGLTCALLYCDVEGRTEGGPSPLAPQDGGRGLLAALAAADFTDVTTHEGAGGYRVYFAR